MDDESIQAIAETLAYLKQKKSESIISTPCSLPATKVRINGVSSSMRIHRCYDLTQSAFYEQFTITPKTLAKQGVSGEKGVNDNYDKNTFYLPRQGSLA